MPSRADYEKELEFCENTLPEMQASCVVLPDVLGEAVMKIENLPVINSKH